MAAITVTKRLDISNPDQEIIIATPANTNTYVSKFRVVEGFSITPNSSSQVNGTDFCSASSSGATLTFAVSGTARKQTIVIYGHD